MIYFPSSCIFFFNDARAKWITKYKHNHIFSLHFGLTLAVGTSCRNISIKLITLQERKPEAEKSRGDVTLLMAINTST